MKYSHPQTRRFHPPRAKLSFKKTIRILALPAALIMLTLIVTKTSLLRIQSTDFVLPNEFSCITPQELTRFEAKNSSIILFDTDSLEQKLEQIPCIDSAFVEILPSRTLKVTLTQSRPVANYFINPELENLAKIATSSVELKTATAEAILTNSSLIDTSQDLNTRALIQPRFSTDSAKLSLPKLIVGENTFKSAKDFTPAKIIPVLECFAANLYQPKSALFINNFLIIYYFTISNGFVSSNLKLLISPDNLPSNFCSSLQEIIQKSTIDGIKLDSIDLRFKDPVVNLKNKN